MAFDKGTEVCSIDGAIGAYVAELNGGHLVQPIYTDENDEPHYGRVETWSEVFLQPPEQRLHERIGQLNHEIAETEMELDSLREQVAQQTAILESAARLRAAQPQLEQLDLWLSGGATHIVVCEMYHLEIGTAEEILKRKDDGSMRLVSLFGDKDRRYRWQMATYSDGSGSGTPCILASSLEDARERAAAWLAQRFRSGDAQHYRTSLARDAIRLGLPVPDDIRALTDEEDRTNAEKHLQHARNEADSAVQKLVIAERRMEALKAVA